MRHPTSGRLPLSLLPVDSRLAWRDGRVPVSPYDLRLLAAIHRGSFETSALFLRAAHALQAGARTIAGVYFDRAAATLGIEHHTEATTAEAFA